MPAYKILMSNLGYLRGIDGRLIQHLLYMRRHFYCPVDVQKGALQQLLALMEVEDPDICCFVEIDTGSSTSADFNQVEALVSKTYPFFDSENKYAPHSRLRTLPRARGKSNAFIAKWPFPFEKIYFSAGTKRLIYKVRLAEYLTLFFAHFSLKKTVRAQQLRQVRNLLIDTPGESIFLGDFNILTGFTELAPLLHQSNLCLMNSENQHTFTFHRFRKVLDLCICSQSLAPIIDLRVIPQPFSDHAALLVKVDRT